MTNSVKHTLSGSTESLDWLAVMLMRLAWSSLTVLSCAVFYFFAWRRFESHLIIVLVGSVLLCFAWFVLRPLFRWPVLEDRGAAKVSAMLVGLMALGISLRIGFVLLNPPVQTSDFLSYWDAAGRLLSTGSYTYSVSEQTMRAFRPPGYPAFLAALFWMVGENPWIPTVTNILFYGVTSAFSYLLAVHFGGRRAGVIAVLVLAVWPQSIAITGLAASEPVGTALFTVATYTYLRAIKGSRACLIGTGILTGCGVLIRPALIVLPVLWLLHALMDREHPRAAFRAAFIATVVMVATLTPWMARNYLVLDAVVPVSTNGGSVFYRANNPMATGDYTTRGERDLDQFAYDEVLWNKTGFEWGKQWIIKNPVAFLRLAVRKEATLLGGDWGIFWYALTPSKEFDADDPVFRMVGLYADAWWLFVWALILCGLTGMRERFTKNADGATVLWMTMFFVVVHSVFESQMRYHMPMYGLLAVLAAQGVGSIHTHNSSSR